MKLFGYVVISIQFLGPHLTTGVTHYDRAALPQNWLFRYDLVIAMIDGYI